MLSFRSSMVEQRCGERAGDEAEVKGPSEEASQRGL